MADPNMNEHDVNSKLSEYTHELHSCLDQLAEDEGIIRMLRRHRDTAEEKLDYAEVLINQLITTLAWAIPGMEGNDKLYAQKQLELARASRDELYG